MPTERTPLLAGLWDEPEAPNPHEQFCMLVGVPPSDLPSGSKVPSPGRKTLYGRATHQYASTRFSYAFMASLSNTLLLSQVILGAAITGLGASQSPAVLITIFGAMNTVIAGLVAYLKSRGQPNRSRMFRDDLERVVDEIENSEVMWLGISKGIHGYDEIDIDDKVTVRSEIGRLTRLYERAIRNNTLNNPDNYLMGGGNDPAGTALRARPVGIGAGPPQLPIAQPIAGVEVGGPAGEPAGNVVAPPMVADPDESPATAPPKPPTPPPPVVKESDAGVAKDDGEDDKNTKKPAEEPAKDSTKDVPKDLPEDAAKDDIPPPPPHLLDDPVHKDEAAADGPSGSAPDEDSDQASEPAAGSSRQNEPK